MEALATKVANAFWVCVNCPSPSPCRIWPIPDTPVAQAATDCCHRAAGPNGAFIVEQNLSTVFGVAVAKHLATIFDKGNLLRGRVTACTIWHGPRNMIKRRQPRVIHEMIAQHRHLACTLLRDMPPEIHLVNQGAGVDVAGFILRRGSSRRNPFHSSAGPPTLDWISKINAIVS